LSVVSQIARNVSTQWLAFGIRGAIGVFLVPFLISSLGREFYGIAILIGVIISFAEVADLGLRTALGRYLSEALAKGDSAHYSRLVSSAALFWILISAFGSGVIVFFADVIVAFLNIKKSHTDDAIILLQSFGVGLLMLAFIRPIFNAVLSSHNRFDLISRAEVASAVINGAGLFLLLGPCGFGIYAWACVTLGVRAVTVLFLACMAFRLKPDLKLLPQNFSFSALREMFSLGWQLFFLQISELLSVKSNPIVLTHFLGESALSLYRPGMALVGLFRPLVMVLSQQLYPVTTRYVALDRNRELEKALFLGTRVTFSLGIGAYVVMGCFSQSIARIWLGNSLGDDYQLAGHIILGCACLELIKCSGGSVWAILVAKKRVRFWIYTQIPLSIFSLIVSVWLVSSTALGVIAVIIPVIVAWLISRVLTMIYIGYLFEFSLIKYLREAYLRPGIVLLLFIGVTSLLEINFPSDSLFELSIVLSVASSIWLFLFLMISLRSAEVKMIVSKMLKKPDGTTVEKK